MEKRIDYFEIVLKTLIILGVLLIIYWFFQLMFGGSLTLEQFNVGFIFVLIGLIVHLSYKSGKFN